MKKKYTLFSGVGISAFIAISILLWGAQQSTSNQSFATTETPSLTNEDTFLSTEELSDCEKPSPSFQYFLEDESVVYTELNNGDYTVYRYYYPSKEKIKIGTVNNFLVNVTPMGRIDNNLFFCVYQGNDTYAKNALYQVDLDNNKLICCEIKDDASVFGVFAYPLDNNIVMLKNVVNEDQSINTFYDIYSVSSGKQKKFNEKKWYSYEENGAALFAYYADGEYLYSFQDTYLNNGETVETRLIQYDSSLREVNNYLLQGEILDYIHSGRIKEATIENGYLYLINTSNFSYVGKLQEDSITPIWENRESLMQAIDADPDKSIYQVYFVQWENQVYFLDINTGKITSVQIPLPDGMSIRFILTNGDKLFIDMYIRDKNGDVLPNKICVYEIENLLNS